MAEARPAAVPAPQAQEPDANSPVLSKLQVARLEAGNWKCRALLSDYNDAKRALEDSGSRLKRAQAEFVDYAAAQGIDVSRDFEWDDEGRVRYLSPARKGRAAKAPPAEAKGK